MPRNGLPRSNEYRIAQLEKSYDRLDEKMDSVLTNHLPHLQQELEKLNTRILMFTGINVVAIVLSVFLHQILG